MASPNPDVAVSSITKYMNGKVDNNTLLKSPLVWWLENKGTVKYGVGGVSYTPQAHIYQMQDPYGWNGRNMGSFPDPVMFRNPVHQWCGYIVQYMTLLWDQWENKEGDTRRFDREEEILKAYKKRWDQFFEAKFWLDNSTASPAGVVGIPGFMKGSGTYGTLTQSVSTNPAWTPTLLDGTSGLSGKPFASAPIDVLRRLINNHAQKGASSSVGITDRPSVGFTTQAIYEHLLSYHTAKAFTPVTVKTDEVGFNFANVVELNVPIYWSPQATSAQIQLLNPEDFEIVFQSPKKIMVRMSEPDQPLGELVQMFNKFLLCCKSPYNQAQLHTAGVT